MDRVKSSKTKYPSLPESREIALEDFLVSDQILIDKANIKLLKKQFPDSKKQIIDGITDLVQRRKLSYPYKRFIMTQSDVSDIFHKLKKSKLKTVHTPFVINRLIGEDIDLTFQGEFNLLILPKDDYYVFGTLTDYFQENVRIKCLRNDQSLSSYMYWNQNAGKVAEVCYDKYQHIDTTNLRHELFNLHYEVGTFRLSVAKQVISQFSGTNILDPCSGWGDRLIASLASNVKSYTGFDPNKKLFPGYSNICDMFNEKTEVVLNCCPFELSESKLVQDKYDLVFTCPPYFDLEIYDSIDPKQSTNKFPTLDSWVEGFLFPMLELSWRYLIEDGHMVVVINDCRSHYVKRMIEHINSTFADAKYLGCIGFAKDISDDTFKYDSPQPIWVWQKL